MMELKISNFSEKKDGFRKYTFNDSLEIELIPLYYEKKHVGYEITNFQSLNEFKSIQNHLLILRERLNKIFESYWNVNLGLCDDYSIGKAQIRGAWNCIYTSDLNVVPLDDLIEIEDGKKRLEGESSLGKRIGLIVDSLGCKEIFFE